MNHERATYILLDALEEMALRLNSTVSDVRRALNPEATGETEKKLDRLVRADCAHRATRTTRAYIHPIVDNNAFPDYYTGSSVSLPPHEAATVGLGYDDRGRTIFSELHKPIEWQEGTPLFSATIDTNLSYNDVLSRTRQGRFNLGEPVRIVVFGEVDAKLQTGHLSQFFGSQPKFPILFSGFDENSKIRNFNVEGSIRNVAFDGLTVKDVRLGEAENVLFENCLIDGEFSVLSPSRYVEFRFCEFAKGAIAKLENVNRALVEWCRFHEINQLSISGEALSIGYFYGPDQNFLTR